MLKIENQIAPPIAARAIGRIRLSLALAGAVLAIGISLGLLLIAQPRLYFNLSAQDLTESSEAVQTAGFYVPQTDPGGTTYVWTKDSATIWLPQPAPKTVRIEIEARSAAVAGGTNAPVGLVFADANPWGYQFQPDPHNATFQKFSFDIAPYWATEYNSNLYFNLNSPTFKPAANDDRQLGTMIKSVTIDLSEAWSPLGKRMWLPWLLAIWPLLIIGIKWLALRRRHKRFNQLAGILAVLGSFGALMTMGLLLKMGPVDKPVQYWWLAGQFYLVLYFSSLAAGMSWGEVGSLSPAGYVASGLKQAFGWWRAQAGWKARGRQSLNWWHQFADVSVSKEESLAEFYRYRWLVGGLLVLSIVITVYWCIAITPQEWLWLMLGLTVVVFLLTVGLTAKQLWESRAYARLYTKPVMGKWWQHNRVAWVVIFGVGLVFDLILNSFQVQWNIWDALFYDTQSLLIPTPYSFRPFGYTAVIKAIRDVVGSDYYATLFLIQAILNSFNGVLIFSLMLLITGRKGIAWTGGLLCAVCPFTAGFTAAILTETCATFFLTTTVFLSVLVLKRSQIYFYYILLGFSAILLLEIRYNFELYLIVPLVLIVLGTRSRLRERLQKLVLTGLLIVIILLPSVIFNYKTFHEVIPFTRADNFSYSIMLATNYDHGHWFRALSDVDKARQLQAKYPLASNAIIIEQDPAHPDLAKESAQQVKNYVKDYFATNSRQFIQRTMAHLWDEWNQVYIFPYSMPLPAFLNYGGLTMTLNRLYLLLFVSGLLCIFRYKLVALPIVSAIGYVWLTQALFAVEPRYMLPIYPIMLGLVALGVWWIGGSLYQWWHTRARPATGVRRAPWRAWVALPAITLALIIFLSTAIDSATYQADTFGLQLGAIGGIFDSLDSPYYASHIDDLLNELHGMETLPEIQIPYYRSVLDDNLARAYLYTTDFNKTVEYATKALELVPNDYTAYHWRSEAWLKLGRTDLAQQDDAKFRQFVPPANTDLAKLTK